MTLFTKKCIELIESGKLTMDKIVNPQIRAEVEKYFAEKNNKINKT